MTPKQLADDLEGLLFSWGQPNNITLSADQVRDIVRVLRSGEAEGKDLIAYAARYSWLREERDEQQPVVTIATFSDWGQPWRDVPLWGDELDAAVDKAMASSSRSEEKDDA